MFSLIPSLYPLDISSNSLDVTTKNVTQLCPLIKQNTSLSLSLSLSFSLILSLSLAHTHWEPLSQLDEWRYLTNECRQTQMQILVSLFTACVSYWARDLTHLSLSFLLCTVRWMTSMYQGCRKPPRSHICKSVMAVIPMCVLNPASPPWMSLQRPRSAIPSAIVN